MKKKIRINWEIVIMVMLFAFYIAAMTCVAFCVEKKPQEYKPATEEIDQSYGVIYLDDLGIFIPI
jgi:flagellar basal body-associated protein FliL